MFRIRGVPQISTRHTRGCRTYQHSQRHVGGPAATYSKKTIRAGHAGRCGARDTRTESAGAVLSFHVLGADVRKERRHVVQRAGVIGGEVVDADGATLKIAG